MNKIKTIALLILFSVMVTGCSRVTMENYDKLEMGMSQQEVEAVIGSPDKCEDNLATLNCSWGDEDGPYISVHFTADRAVYFSQKGL